MTLAVTIVNPICFTDVVPTGIIEQMPLERKQSRTVRPKPSSFRFSEEAFKQLKLLSITLNMSQVEVLEALLTEEYERAKKKYSQEMRKAMSLIASSKE